MDRGWGPAGEAHPRSRGENYATRRDLTRPSGSSPLTRGKLVRFTCCSLCSGLIPAHAGKTSWRGQTTRPGPAHPRSRGENCARGLRSCVPRGSSPLTRGKRPLGCPTRPRTGSSPLTRGKQLQVRRTLQAVRLIPAHAGKTAASASPTARMRAHPRSRGENGALAASAAGVSGSSPLTRGKRPVAREAYNLVGLIPAHAGKTSGPSKRVIRPWAHPRSRGENRMSVAVTLSGLGSSPLTRGKPPGGCACQFVSGLIPAHAGKTTRRSPPCLTIKAHPRSRGENRTTAKFAPSAEGSSPLTRGKRMGCRRR